MSEINASRLLDPGEELIWSGRPNAVWFAIRRLPWWPLLIVFIGLVVSISLSFEAARLPAPTNPKSISPLAMARAMREMAVVAALFSVVIALWLWWRAFRTTHLLTNRRVVIDTPGPIARRTSVPLEHLRLIEFRSKLLGPSDLVFSERQRLSFYGWGPRGEGFIAIANAAHVERQVRDAIEQTFATRTRGPWQ